MITWKTAQKCLDFAEGKKGKTLFYGVKNDRFPQSLLDFNETEQAIKEMHDDGLSLSQIGERLHITTQAVSLRSIRIRGKQEFYSEWQEFTAMLESTGTGIRPLIGILEKESDKKEEWEKKLDNAGIITIADFIRLTVVCDKNVVGKTLKIKQADISRIFACIAGVLEPLLTAYDLATWKKNAKPEVEGQLNMFDILPELLLSDEDNKV